MDTDTAAPAATIPRAPGDTDRSYAALCRFALMGPERSLRALAQQPDSASVAQLFRWSAAHDWMARVRAYDLAVAAQAQQAFADEAVLMARQHAQEAATLRAYALQALDTIPAESLPAAVALRLWTEAVRIERLSLGLPTENARLDATVSAQATVRAEVARIRTLLDDPAMMDAARTFRHALSARLQPQQRKDEHDDAGY